MSRGLAGDALRIAVLALAVIGFATPLVASGAFGFSLPAVGPTLEPLFGVVEGTGFWPPVWASLGLAVATTVASMALLVPTLLWLHLRAPQTLAIFEAISVLPYVVPAIALVTGANAVFRALAPGFLTHLYSLVPFYVIITMPLVYRALDNGLRALDLRTLVAASTSLGAGPLRTLVGVILPNMRAALLTATMLSITLVLGEFVLATLLLHSTYPVLLAQLGQDNPRAAAALAVLTLLGTWLLLALATEARPIRRRTTPRERTSR